MPNKINLIGQTFGHLTVVEESSKRSGGHVTWLCKCSCGNPELVCIDGNHLRSGHTKSCGCLQKEKASEMMKKIQPLGVKSQEKDLTGKKFGLLTVIKFIHIKNQKRYWLCQCDCGNEKIVSTNDLTSHHTNSCGCLKCSLGELKIKEILQKNNISFVQEKTFKDCIYVSRMRFDFYVDDKYLIEYDGKQHFELTGWRTKEEFEEDKIRDQIKTNWCEINNIPLIRIPYTIKDITLEDISINNKYRVV